MEKMEDSMSVPLSGSGRPSTLRTVASYIIATEFCERLAYYGFAGSLVLFFEAQLNMSNEDAVNNFYLWNGAVYVTPLLGGYIADTWLGRYNTILTFAIVYLGGLALFLGGSVPGHISVALVFLGMYIVALGAGGIKPNCSTMGADQFDANYPQDQKESKQFFSYFYWSINLGALLAYTLVAYICQYGLPGLGGEKWGFFVGYLIPTIALGIGIAVFVSGSNRYKKFLPKGSMVSRALGIMWEAGYTRRGIARNNYGSTHWLDSASKDFGGSYNASDVNSVKYVTRLFPYLGIMIPYWGIYGQTKTAFQIQGCQMDSRIGTFQLPISGMNIFNNIAILALVPLFEQVLYPYMKSQGMELRMLWKMGLGFIFAIIAMLVAASIEEYRLHEAPPDAYYISSTSAERDNISPCRSLDNYNPNIYVQWWQGEDVDKPSNCWQISGCDVQAVQCVECDPIPQMSPISIFWQIPQFVLIGISEIFASITSLEFFYSQAPMSMRSVSQALNLFTNALGSWLTIPLTLLVNCNPNDPWISDNIDDGHLNYYFFLLAGIMTAAYILFCHLCNGFQYVNETELEALNKQCDAEEEGTAALLAEENSSTTANPSAAVAYKRSKSTSSNVSSGITPAPVFGEEF